MKTNLSAELKRVQKGLVLTVVDHKRPVATLNPLADEALFVREATETYIAEELPPLVSTDPLTFLEEERAESW
ncbi:MAG: hypothetical protein A2Z99_08705 [Treponema sp. GWB1_62_6]|nr:MAG: hypothetical protein A2Z99_08705 [Treponema sp. GWB1_62_6]HCM25749.1 hypothetical protein [Treponema sp.]